MLNRRPSQPSDAYSRRNHARIVWPETVIKGQYSVFEVLEESKVDIFSTAFKTFTSDEYGTISSRNLSKLQQPSSSTTSSSKDKDISTLFGLKSECLSTPFRVLKLKSVPTQVTRQSSYIALSYCAPGEDWITDFAVSSFMPDPQQNTNLQRFPDKLPITDVMTRSFLKERINTEEGVWIDRLCIENKNSEEVAAAKGMMDVIYSSARLVVVLLEDIVLDVEESDFIRQYLTWYERGDTLEEGGDIARMLTAVFCKIMFARWFRRAWCANEYRWSTRCIFLLGMIEDTGGRNVSADGERDETPRVSSVLRFTSEFLEHLASIAMQGSGNNALDNTAADEIVIVSGFETALDFLLKHPFLRMLGLVEDSTTSKHGDDGNDGVESVKDTEVEGSVEALFKQNLEFNTSVDTDRLNLAVTTSDLGLYYKGPEKSDEELEGIVRALAALTSDDEDEEAANGESKGKGKGKGSADPKDWVMI